MQNFITLPRSRVFNYTQLHLRTDLFYLVKILRKYVNVQHLNSSQRMKIFRTYLPYLFPENHTLKIIAVCMCRLVMIGKGLSETAHFGHS